MFYQCPGNARERGIALLLVLAILTTLTLLGLAIVSNGITEGQISENFGAEVSARWLAETGGHRALAEMRGKDLTAVLLGPNGRPDSPEGEARRFDFRNPIALRGSGPAPQRLDLSDAQQVGAATRHDDGVLLRIGRGGVGYYRRKGPDGRFDTEDDASFFDTEQAPQPDDRLIGRYLVKVTNNSEDPGGPYFDTDGMILIRSMGLVQMNPARRLWGARNAMAVIEVKIRSDQTFQTESPVNLLGPALIPESARILEPGRTQIQGQEFLGWAIINSTAAFSDPVTEPMTQELIRTAGSEAILGAGLIRSIRNISGLVPSDQTWTGAFNPDTKRALDPVWLRHWIMNKVPTWADQTFRRGDPGPLAWQGTVEDPKLICVDGDLSIGGNPSGAGLLVVNGRLRLNGNPAYRGLILVIGEQAALDVQGQPLVEGGIWISRVRAAGQGAVFDPVRCSIRGTFRNRRPSYQTLASSLLPYVQIQWREIHPEMDP